MTLTAPPERADRPQFCCYCGGPLGPRDFTGGWRCSSCKKHSFLDPKVAACVVPWWEGRLVLVRRAIEPRAGFWATPGGYVERNEPPAHAAKREAWEETGLVVEIKELLGVYATPGYPVIVVMYDCEVTSGGPPRPLSECSEVGLFAPQEIPWSELAFPSVGEALCTAIAHHKHLWRRRENQESA